MDVFITNLVAIISFELSVIDQNGGLATILGIAEQGSVLPDTINVAIQDDSTKVGNRGGKASKQASQPASQPAGDQTLGLLVSRDRSLSPTPGSR